MNGDASYPVSNDVPEDIAGSAAEQAHSGKSGTLEFLLRRMRHKSDFPALSDSVSAINRLATSESANVDALANIILKDYALTNKILRLVNSAFYRQVGGGNISTVSRAVVVLGFDAIRNIAITVLLFEHLEDKANVHELKEAFLRANLAALLARASCRGPLLQRRGEEAFICALFHGLGRLLAKYYFPEEVEEIDKLIEFKKLAEDAATIKVLGLTYEELGIGIARNWGFPATIIHSMHRLSAEEIRKPNSVDEALRIVAGYANEFCDQLAATPDGQGGKVMARMAQRFSSSLQMSAQQMQECAQQAVEELGQIASSLRVSLRQSPFARRAASLAGGNAEEIDATLAAQSSTLAPQSSSTAATLVARLPTDAILPEGATEKTGGIPADAQAVLSAGIQDISNSLVEDFALNDILRIILETMYRAMGFKHVLFALRDAKTGMMTGRFGLGPEIDDLVRQFRFALSSRISDVFQLATARGLDIFISDIDDAKIVDEIPLWYREHIPAKTFVLFPLNIKGKPVALIYCDHDKAGSIVIPERELMLLKTLRNQALLAIKQAA